MNYILERSEALLHIEVMGYILVLYETPLTYNFLSCIGISEFQSK